MMYLHPEYVDFSKAECIKMDGKFTKYPDIVTYDEFGEKTPMAFSEMRLLQQKKRERPL